MSDEGGDDLDEAPLDRAMREARACLALGAAVAEPKTGLAFRDHFGDYEIVGALGDGGQGVVYQARHSGVHRTVALKIMRGADLATADELRRFRYGAEAAANLDHPNIVPVFHVGECEGTPFFTMRYVPGGDLRSRMDDFRSDPVKAAWTMAKVARAVHHAHERCVIHRDLKPANVLLDEHLEPHVADFGLARAFDKLEVQSASGQCCGSVPYMAREQAFGSPRDLTPLADVYSLGAILYELLTGNVPYDGDSPNEILGKLYAAGPIPSPRSVDHTIDSDLSLIAMKCLRHDPGERYGSAKELALDLERWVERKPISLVPLGRLMTALHWCRRHPVAATVLSGALLVLFATAVVGWHVARGQQDALRREMLEVNQYAAQATAGQVLLQLRDLSDHMTACAADPRIVELFRPGQPRRTPRSEQLLREWGAGSAYDSLTLLDTGGMAIGRGPSPPLKTLGKSFAFRDYFAGARRMGEQGRRGIHAGRAHISEADDQLKLSLGTPVFEPQGGWVGVINTTIGSDSSLGALRLRENGRQMAVLVGLRDRERHEENAEMPRDYMVIVHDRLDHGRAMRVVSPALEELSKLHAASRDIEPLRPSGPEQTLADDNHSDPVPGFEGRWLAGFAPVGHTGYAVIVQTRYEAPLELPRRALFSMLGWCGAALGLGAALVFVAARLLGSAARGRSRLA